MVLGCFFGCNDIWSAKDQIHMHYWLSLFGQDGWKLTNFFSCVFSWMETKSRLTQKKGTRQISSYLDQQTWSIEYSLLSKKNFTLIRIKNDPFFFFLRAGKERWPCSQQNKFTSHLICFLGLFYFFLPLFMNFLIPLHETFMRLKQVILREQDVPILPAY